MRERLPFGGALQRAALQTYSGIVGHMAMPDNAEEQRVIEEVARKAHFDTKNAAQSDRGMVWIPVVASGPLGRSVSVQSLGRV
jgi:hypothetical protein